MLATGTLLQGRYRVERLLGEGGMGRVYLAHHQKLDTSVALKELRVMSREASEQAMYVDQFLSEARILSTLQHPNVARVMDFFEEGGTHYLVMEFIEGRTLEQVMELAARGLTEKKVLAWAEQVLDALEYLHGQPSPIIVRDLNPRNIMLEKGERLKIIDFGISKRLAPGSRTGLIVRAMGSEGYAPLEQYGRGVTDQRSDLYSLGATLYYLLTREAPPSPPERLMSGGALPDLRRLNSTVSARLRSAIEAMMAIEPDSRPASAGEVRRLLGLSGEEPPPRPREPVRGAPRRGKQCPLCAVSLRESHYRGVEIDYCPRCRGLWLDHGELKTIVERATESEGHRHPQEPSGDHRKPKRTRSLFRRLVDLLLD